MAQLKLTNHGVTVTLETDNEDLSISEWFDLFRAALIGITFTNDQVSNYIVEEGLELYKK
jgi:hypothetical protein